ncbi:hypothetical protein ACWGID_29360 [Kribbella sp. NPDC054772]
MNAVSIVGNALELCGFATTAIGLFKAWRDNPGHGRFLSPRLDALWERLRVKVLRLRPRPAPTTRVTSSRSTYWRTKTSTPSVRMTDESSTDERIQQLARDLAQTTKLALETQQALHQLAVGSDTQLRELHTDLRATQADLERKDIELATGGIPLAVVGLGFAVVGMLLQLIGSC